MRTYVCMCVCEVHKPSRSVRVCVCVCVCVKYINPAGVCVREYYFSQPRLCYAAVTNGPQSSSAHSSRDLFPSIYQLIHRSCAPCQLHPGPRLNGQPPAGMLWVATAEGKENTSNRELALRAPALK